MTSADPAVVNTWDATIVRCLVLVASALVGGAALVRPLTGPLNPAASRLVAAAAGAAVAALVDVAVAGRTPWSLVIVQAVSTLAIVFISNGPIAAAGGAALLVAVAVEGTAGGGWMDTVLGIALTGAAAVWCAAAVIVAMAAEATRRPLLRRLVPVAASAGVLVAATGGVQAWRAGLRLDATTAESAYARLLAVAAALLVGAAACGLLGYRRFVAEGERRTGVGALRVSAVGLIGALIAGAALAAVEAPPAPPVPGVPLLRTVAVADTRVPVVVAPQRPGWNVVHVGADGAMVGVDRDHLTPAMARPAATGGWADVALPAGRSRLWIRYGGRLTSLRLDTGGAGGTVSVTGPDAPECVSAVLGTLLAGREAAPTACPADRLADADAGTLRALVTFLAGRGVRAVTVVDDPSPRSQDAAEVVRAAAARNQLAVALAPRPDSAAIVVSGWAAADRTLRGVDRGELPALGIYLAPWLANSRLLGYRSGAVVALRYDPRDTRSLRYASVLDARFTGEVAATAGYEAWSAATGRTTGRTYLYAAATISLLPADVAHDHGVRGGWLPGGGITRVTPALGE